MRFERLVLFMIKFLIVTNAIAQGCEKDISHNYPKVDSFFMVNFQVMSESLNYNIPQGDGTLDRNFLYLLTYMSGVDCHTSDYSGFCYFTEQEYLRWKDWYDINKYKIKWSNVEKGMSILKKPSMKTEEDYEFLLNLKL